MTTTAEAAPMLDPREVTQEYDTGAFASAGGPEHSPELVDALNAICRLKTRADRVCAYQKLGDILLQELKAEEKEAQRMAEGRRRIARMYDDQKQLVLEQERQLAAPYERQVQHLKEVLGL